MIRITDKSLCTGCTACMNACPVQCIVFRRDREGFDYPVANPDRCINCGKCEKVCPVLNPREQSVPLEAAAARNEAFIKESSSGGAFSALACKMINEGAVIYGAVINEDMTVGHTDACDMDGVARMRGSKYVQSDLYGTFDEVRYYLEEGRKVMFTGTPCQIAGLNSYLGKPYEGLLTIDFACHGVPSPGLWEKYVKALEKSEGGRMTNVMFRDKSRSWMHYDFVCGFETAGKHPEIRKPYRNDPYMSLFVQDMTLRPSCYKCPARKGRSGSDLTLADLWNVAKTLPQLNDDKGVSLILINTEKGRRAVSEANMQTIKVNAAEAVRNNGGFSESIAMPEKREAFFKGHHSADNLIRYMRGYVKVRPFRQLYKNIRAALSGLKRRIVR